MNTLLSTKGIWDVVNFTMVPFGNAYYDIPQCKGKGYPEQRYCWANLAANGSQAAFNGDLVCQHGADECYANLVEACAVDAYPAEKYWPFIYCYEGENECKKGSDKTCATKAGLDWSKIEACTKNGDELTKRVAIESAKGHGSGSQQGGTPDPTVNNKHVEFSSLNLKLVCKKYKEENPSAPTPSACS